MAVYLAGMELKISAPILDESFYNKLVTHEYVIGTGDILRVVLRIHQYKDTRKGVWINESYDVLEVLEHTPGPHQGVFFEKEA